MGIRLLAGLNQLGGVAILRSSPALNGKLLLAGLNPYASDASFGNYSPLNGENPACRFENVYCCVDLL
jgi:hypothetical protein